MAQPLDETMGKKKLDNHTKLVNTMTDTTEDERIAEFCKRAGVKKVNRIPPGSIGILFDTVNDQWFHVTNGELTSIGSGRWPLVPQEILEQQMELKCRDVPSDLFFKLDAIQRRDYPRGT